MTYEWSQLEGPQVSLDDANSVIATLVAPQVSSDALLRFQLKVTDDGGNVGTDMIDITVVNAFYPALSLPIKTIDIGTVSIGQTAQESLVISNTGNEALVITGIELSRSVFRANPQRMTLAPGESQMVTVEFTPDEPASFEATLRFVSNTIAGVQTIIVLKGTAPAPEVEHSDTGLGGSLVPAPPLQQEPVTPPAPEAPQDDRSGESAGTVGPLTDDAIPPDNSSPEAGPLRPDVVDTDDDGGVTESSPGPFRARGIGGCSLVEPRHL